MASEDLRGTLHFAMLYDAIAGILTVKLIEAQDLQPRDFSGTADPYAKVRLLPDASKINMWQTRIHKRTLNPGMRVVAILCNQFYATFFSLR